MQSVQNRHLENSQIRIVSDRKLVPEGWVSLNQIKEDLGASAYHFISRCLHNGKLKCGVKVMKRMNQRMGPIFVDYGPAERYCMENHTPRRVRLPSGELVTPDQVPPTIPTLPPHEENGQDRPPASLNDILDVAHVEREVLDVLKSIEEKIALNNTLTARVIDKLDALREVWE